jgi:hypothetical protein
MSHVVTITLPSAFGIADAKPARQTAVHIDEREVAHRIGTTRSSRAGRTVRTGRGVSEEGLAASVHDRETLAEFPSMHAGGVRTNPDLRDDAADCSDA